MNNYKITFQRSDGSIGSDVFTEKTEQEVRIAFKACYRNDVYKIISVEKVL